MYLFKGISKSTLSAYATLFDNAIKKKIIKIKIIDLNFIKFIFFIFFSKIIINEKNIIKPPRPI